MIPKPHVSSREGIISRCCRFDLLHFRVLARSDTARPSVVAAKVRCRWRSVERDRRTMPGRCAEGGFGDCFKVYFAYKNISRPY